MTTREAFEEWYEVDCYPCEHSNWFRLDSDGDYEFDEVQSAWRTWQAATETVITEYRQQCLDNAAEIELLRGELHQHECTKFDAVREQRDFLLTSQALLIESANIGQDAQAAEIARLRAALATAPEFPADWAQMIHYPECWDTAAYPELRDAIHEALAGSGCSVCKPATAPERKPMPILEVNARWEQSVLGITRLQYYQVVREVEAFHGITGGKP